MNHADDVLEMSGIREVSDFKDGTIFVLLGSEILGSEKLNTCKDYVYIKIGDKLMNNTGWFPVEAYDDIYHSFYLKHNSKLCASLEYEIREIYKFDESIYKLDFSEIYKTIQTLTPIWVKDDFKVSNISIEDYFLSNFDIDIFVDEGEE